MLYWQEELTHDLALSTISTGLPAQQTHGEQHDLSWVEGLGYWKVRRGDYKIEYRHTQFEPRCCRHYHLHTPISYLVEMNCCW